MVTVAMTAGASQDFLPARYFLAPRLRFLRRRYLLRHLRQRVASMSLRQPQLKHIFIRSLACEAILFFSGSVTGIAMPSPSTH